MLTRVLSERLYLFSRNYVKYFSINLNNDVSSKDYKNNETNVEKIRTKHKTPIKRASALRSVLNKEILAKLINGREYPEINPGDAISIEMLPYVTSATVEIVKGVVTGISNRGADTLIYLINTESGTPIQRQIFKYGPLVKKISIVEASFLYRKRKAKITRRRKLYYVENINPKEYTVK